jgi:hypothetical protein
MSQIAFVKSYTVMKHKNGSKAAKPASFSHPCIYDGIGVVELC